jgi:hypothetical protein
MTGDWRRQHNKELFDCTSTKYYSDDQLKNSGMGGACGMYGGEFQADLRRGNPRENLENLGVDEG